MTADDMLLLRVEVPICAFRPFASREYQDTYPVPTPASVFGMLLSFLGVGWQEEQRHEEKQRHAGVRMSLALSPSREDATTVDEALPWRSSVFRKLRRVSQYGYGQIKKQGSDATNQFVVSKRRPDYQDVLTDVTLWVWLAPGEGNGGDSLVAMLDAVLDGRACVFKRHGGLSLGESSYLVNRINAVGIERLPPQVVVLRPTTDGFYSLPVWTDHKNDRSRSERFELALTSPHPPCWFTVAPLDSE